jgi:hypothetical protein
MDFSSTATIQTYHGGTREIARIAKIAKIAGIEKSSCNLHVWPSCFFVFFVA